jgi:hypothetical protein
MSRYGKGERASYVSLGAHEGVSLRKKERSNKKGWATRPTPKIIGG